MELNSLPRSFHARSQFEDGYIRARFESMVSIDGNNRRTMKSMRLRMYAGTRSLCGSVALTMLTASPQVAVAVVTGTGTVTSIYIYPDFGSGASGCEGFWLSPSQARFKTTVAMILQARATGEAITVGGNNATLWAGSATGTFCNVEWLRMSS